MCKIGIQEDKLLGHKGKKESGMSVVRKKEVVDRDSETPTWNKAFRNDE